MTHPPLPWSHSSLQAFETCPRQYEEIKVLRNFQGTDNAANLWGNEFHSAAEAYIKERVAGGIAHLPVNMAQYHDYLETFIARPGTTLAEQEYALDKQLKPCAFAGPDVWSRGIIDVLTLDGPIAYVDDHKTGKNRKKDMQQLMIFALLTFYHHPEVMRCDTTFHWLQLGAKDTESFHRHEIGTMWADLLPKLAKYRDAFHAGVFPAKPSGLCRKHCAVETCEYYQRGPRG